MENLIRVSSHFGPRQTADRLETVICAQGMAWIAYHELACLAQQHGFGDKADRIIDRMNFL